MTQIVFRNGLNGYSGTHDTMLSQATPGSGYGNATTLSADGDDPSGQDTQTLLQFANLFGAGSSQIPLGATITSATLTPDGPRARICLAAAASTLARVSSLCVSL